VKRILRGREAGARRIDLVARYRQEPFLEKSKYVLGFLQLL